MTVKTDGCSGAVLERGGGQNSAPTEKNRKSLIALTQRGVQSQKNLVILGSVGDGYI